MHILSQPWEKEYCSGCSACVHLCPKHCLTMVEDEEGFVYPKVDETKCIDCSLCVKICPLVNEYKIPTDHLPLPLVYAAKHNVKKVREKSTSGGIFTALSDFVLNHGGVVCGAVFNTVHQRVEHTICRTCAERDMMRGAKYVQSWLGDVYPQIKSLLHEGVQVLFTGTPCQCAGLVAFLRKDYSNLFIVDILCHSVPSPLILRETTKMYCNEVKNLAFRNKTLGWRKSYEFTIIGNDKDIHLDKGYLSLFFKRLINRPSCHKCHFTNVRRPSDITIGDYWNINNVNPDFEDNLGISCIFVNSVKGKLLMNCVNNDLELQQTGLRCAMQACTMRQSPMPNDRTRFWKDYHKNGFDYVYKKYGHYTWWETFRDCTLAPLVRNLKITEFLKKIIRR